MRRNSARVARFHAWLEDKQLGTEYYLSDAQVALLERVMEMGVEP